VAELSAGIGLSVDARHLKELLSHIVRNKEPGAFGQDEQVVLRLKHGGNLGVNRVV
jgi:hypothetical protein